MTDLRKDFLGQWIGTMQIYENLNVHGIDPYGEKIEGHHGSFSQDYIAGFRAGQNNAAHTLLSITDSRELNEARWRLTDKEGEVLTFYPKDNLEGHPTKDENGELVFVKGIIVDYYDMVNS